MNRSAFREALFVPNFAHAPDGSPVEVFARIGVGASPKAISAALPRGATILDLGCGAGRISDALADLGHDVLGIDESAAMLERVQRARTLQSRIEDLDLTERFAAVLLSSYLINAPDRASARIMLATAARHVATDGYVLVQRLDPVRGAAIKPGPILSRNGVDVSVAEIEFHGSLAFATWRYDLDGHTLLQPWSFTIITDDQLSAEANAVGLEMIGEIAEGVDWVITRRRSKE